MNSISKAILLSAMGLCVNSGNVTYASIKIPDSIPKSGINTLHTHHTQIRHTLKYPNLSSRLFDDLWISGEEQKVASVCFITDTHKCSVDKFDNTDGPENGNGAPGSGSGETPETPEYKTPEEVCQDAGYGQTPCPEGSSPIPCPVAPNYFACSCDKKFSQKCQAPNYGVGESCGGKYQKCEEDLDRACKEENGNYVTSCPSGWQMSDTKCSFDPSYGLCCNLCNGYTYNDEKDIPEGYVKGETCVNCDNEPWFKLAPNPCDGFYDCSLTAPEIGANSCLSGTVTKYDKCKPCPNLGIYATCPIGYKCEYERCSGKYYKVDGCQDGFDWNAAAKTCTCDNKGTYSSCPTGYLCEYEKCSKKYYKVDGCASGYDWDSYYETCTEHCDYEATLDSCPANGNCWYESCSGKYSLSSCKTSYVREGDTCVCPNKGTLSRCPFGHKCEYETCSKTYIDLGCDVSYGFQYESSIGDCRCTSYPSDYGRWDDFEIFGVEKCTGYFEMTYGGCGRSSMMACARGKQIKRHTNKYCHVYNGSYSAWYANTEELCQFADGSVRTHKIPHPCWRGSSYEKSFRTMEDCEKYLATMPEYDDVYCYGACDHN